MNGRRLSLLVAYCVLVSSVLTAEQQPTPQEQAWQLEQQGKLQDAFLKYLAVPGCEHAALRVAKPKAAEFLALLTQRADEFPAVRVSMLMADLLLALGRKGEALAACRGAAGRVAKEPGGGWAQGLLPANEYLVDVAAEAHRQFGQSWQPAAAFTIGPGSHRDNWLIRRLIALDAWDDAASEFARIWELHRQRARPHAVAISVYDPNTREMVEQKKLVRPAGFDSLGMQFALDYAYFLKRRQQVDQALAVLLEPTLAIDMDRNPNVVRYEEGGEENLPVFRDSRHWRWHGGGVSRKEFIRLAYGEFKSAGKSADLTAAVQKQIEAGENRARLVLSRIRAHESTPDEALKLEMEYVGAGDFDPLTTAYRRGLSFESYGKSTEAAAEYTKVLALPYQAPRLSDIDEETVQSRSMMQSQPVFADPKSKDGRAQFVAGIIQRLRRLHAALGDAQKLPELMLAQFQLVPNLSDQLELLEQLATEFRSTGQEERFKQWARAQAEKAEGAVSRGNLYFLAGDYENAAKAIASGQRDAQGWRGQGWKSRFCAAGKEPLRVLLSALLEANPKDSVTRLELLDLDKPAPGKPNAILSLEQLLAPGATVAFPHGKGVGNATEFQDYYDLAYRLMRLYEKAGQKEKIVALALRVARGDKPFDDKVEPSRYEYRDRNDLPEHANACLAVAIQSANAEDLGALAQALKDSPWGGARRQIERRIAGGWKAAELKTFGWANVPPDVKLLASNENVLCLARDDRFVYAGEPWGVAVYDFAGAPVTRIALGEAALTLVAADGHLWAGTPIGLFRINPKDWRVEHQALDGGIPARERDTHSVWLKNRVAALAVDGEDLWISTHTVQVLNMRTLERRVFVNEDLKTQSNSGFERILPEKDYVWCDSRQFGARRFDRAGGTWEAVTYEGKPVTLVGDVEGTLYGTCQLPEPLRARPCVIERKSLAVTPLLIEGLSEGGQCINGPFAYFGKRNGQLVFGPKYPGFILDKATGKLRPISDPWQHAGEIESDIPPGLRSGVVEFGAGVLTATDDTTHRHTAFGQSFQASSWAMLTLPDGTRVLGGQPSYSPRYQYPSEDYGHAQERRETWDDEGGLYFINPAGQARRVSSVTMGDSLRGSCVYSLADWLHAGKDPDSIYHWLCTNLGLAVMDTSGRLLGHFSRDDGLCANRTEAGVMVGGRFYFASGWGDAAGALTIFDPPSGVFTPLFRQDGLDGNKIEGVAGDNGKIRISYASEYQRFGNFGYRQCLPSTYDPATGTYVPGGEPKILRRDEQPRPSKEQPAGMPYLGGYVLATERQGDTEYLCGTRGLVMRKIGSASGLKFADLGATLQFSNDEKLLVSAREYEKQRIGSADELADALKDKNPFSRANALASIAFKMSDGYLPLIAQQLTDANLRVRSTALYCVARAVHD